jgi:hypothetical protein
MLDRSFIEFSWEERTICLVGREMLRMLEKLVSYRFLYDFKPAPACSSSLCIESPGPSRQWRLVERRDYPAPLTQFKNWGELQVCSDCMLHVQAQHAAGREAVWARLPSAFNLPIWDALAEMQDI